MRKLGSLSKTKALAIVTACKKLSTGFGSLFIFLLFKVSVIMSTPSQLSDQDLYNQVSALLLTAPQGVKDLIDEVVQRWHAAFHAA